MFCVGESNSRKCRRIRKLRTIDDDTAVPADSFDRIHIYMENFLFFL